MYRQLKDTPASNPKKERCPKCGKAIGQIRRAGSITSYLFSAFDCTCAQGGGQRSLKSANVADFANDDADFCPKCGLRIVANFRDGSLTGFLLSDTRCKCPPAEEFADGKMSARFWKLRETGNGTIFSPVADRPTRPAGTFVDLLPGATIGGAYEIIRLIGQGGMGEVYLAMHKALGKKCALKVIPPEQVTEEGWRRFQLEARAVAKLEHKNLVRVTDLGIHEGCLPFYAMDYIEGRNLAEILEHDGPMPLQTVLEIFLQVCDGVEAAHRGGILHRDLKPANIMVSTVGSGAKQAKVLDFGLAKLTGHDRAKQSLTVAGDVFGSPFYMSPEQCNGEKLDNRSDIYSLGCTMFECLTGRPPFSGNLAAAVIFGHLEADPPSLESAGGRNIFSESMEIVMAKLLRKNPVERYQNLMELRSDLLKVMNGETVRPVYVNRSKSYLDNESAYASGTERPAGSKYSVALPLSLGLVVLSLIAFTYVVFTGHITKVSGPAVAGASISGASVSGASTPDARSLLPSQLPVSKPSPAATVRPYRISSAKGWGVREFEFPTDHTLGKLTIFGKNGPVGGSDAIGRVTIPAGVELELEAGPAVVSHPELLDGFGPEDLNGIKFEPGTCDDEQLAHVSRLTGITNISIKDGAVTEKCLNDLNKLVHLTSFVSIGSGLTGPAIAKLKRLPQFTFFSIQAGMPRPALKLLANSKAIRVLNLYDCPIEKEDAALIATMPNLTVIDVARSKADDGCLALLHRFHNLKSLNIDGCPITPRSIGVLKEMQPQILTINAVQWPAAANARLRAALPNCELRFTGQGVRKRLEKALDQSLDDFIY